MNKLGGPRIAVSWLLQFVAAAILVRAAYGKFSGDEVATFIFSVLNISGTIYVVATLEAVAGLLLVTRSFPHYGAILGFGIMMGALIAHCTVLGLEVNHDGGMMVMLMVVVLVSTSGIMWIRRRQLPLIGHTI